MGARPRNKIGLTYREIAERLGVSHAQVQIIERRALVKMARVLEARGLRASDLLDAPEPTEEV